MNTINCQTSSLHSVYLEIDSASALSEGLIETLTLACDEIEDCELPGQLVLRFSGESNSSDLDPWPGEVSLALVSRWERVLRRIERLRGISVCVVSGACGSFALELLMATDYRIGSQCFSLKLRGLDNSCWPSMVLHRVSNRLGVANARRLFLIGGKTFAADACSLGIVDTVSCDPSKAAIEAVESLGHHCDMSVFAARRLIIMENFGRTHEDALGAHLAACDLELRRRRQLTLKGREKAALPNLLG